jgi:hypothetical protein
MKKHLIFLFSLILILNYVTLSANPYIYSENKTNAQIASDSCSFKFLLWDDSGIGWNPITGIAITVDGVDYGFVKLAWGTSYDEVIVALPSGEVQMFWHGGFAPVFHFEVYNSSSELIYATPEFLPGGLFFTYQNECPECFPITDFEGVYIQEEEQMNLSWKAPESMALTGFDIYRNDSLIAHVAPDTIFYSDNTTELESGNYKYCVIPVYPFECNLDEECFEIPIHVGIKNYEDHIMIYPNPATNLIHISGDMALEAKIYNNIGQLILTQHNTNVINVSELQNGIYILSIESSTKQVIQKKIIISR